MSASEFAEWQCYYNREPFGHDIDRLQGGVVASTIANIHRDTKKRHLPYKAKDFTVGGPAPPHVSRETLKKRNR